MLPDLTLTQWAAVGGLLSGVSGMIAAVGTLLVVTLGRKRVQLWVHEFHSQWRARDRYGDGDDDPWVTFTLSNVGDGTVLRLEAIPSVVVHVLRDGRAAERLTSIPMLGSGESLRLGATVPIDQWESAKILLSWRVAPVWPLVSRRRRTLKLARFGERPRASFIAHDEWGRTVERTFSTMGEAVAAQAEEKQQ